MLISLFISQCGMLYTTLQYRFKATLNVDLSGLILILKKFEKDFTEGQSGSTLIILRPMDFLHKPNILFKS